ncbi:phosphoribosylglycinamide formyltransferase [Pueribacillus theae]|uniref:Phosphoribosylglycinamide formyltransferase n=1 Tax=Pueribacillus theae TaxID=2171751 RepID=A0A2U1JZE8_9BACI|nr:phosphoribosylglycinamide formyltransferase [Pueribacillus theae]PWA10324.1 phosphoribosylglycinamide formyltransferase [Pueribacillus theae]
MIKLAVFASGSGSNFQAIVNAMAQGELPAVCALLVCDKPGAKVIERAKKAGVPAFVAEPKNFENKAAYEQAILEKLKESGVEFIALAGYMRLIGPVLLQAYEGKIVNIHPSLLPSFPGLDAVGQAVDAGVKVTGVTIHYVDSGMDTGPIIAQKAVDIDEGDTKDSVMRKVHAIEHQLYPQTLAKLFQKKEEAPISK